MRDFRPVTASLTLIADPAFDMNAITRTPAK
ncbi:MAG: hypothetical protein ACI9KN_002105 [Gammaproteobacteria bacterium]|jgi:hypothetical protein